MTQQGPRTDQAENSSLMLPEMAAMGRKRIEEFAEMQTELLEKLQEANRNWFDHMQSEANLASEFWTKVTAARSIPEAATTCQEWASRRMEMAAEDSKRLLADGQKFMETGSRLWPKGWLSSGGGGSSSS